MADLDTSKEKRFYGTGKRKEAIARVYLSPNGKGLIHINQSTLEKYFGRASSQMIVKQPLELTKMTDLVDIYANVCGGGLAAQADATKYGIAKALIQMDTSFRKILKPYGLLRRDARIVERKKAGQSGARKRYQYSKR